MDLKVIKKFRKVFPNPANLQRKGVKTKIKEIRKKGECFIVEFEGEPAQAELEMISKLIDSEWELIED